MRSTLDVGGGSKGSCHFLPPWSLHFSLQYHFPEGGLVIPIQG